MTDLNHALRAWIDIEEDRVVGAFVGKDEATRAPATRRFRTRDDARHWIETEAAALGLPVEWAASNT